MNPNSGDALISLKNDFTFIKFIFIMERVGGNNGD